MKGEIIQIQQSSPEWRALRKTKVTATDAAVCLGVNPWKSLLQLYVEKTSDYEQPITYAMQRGIDLEPVARDLLELKIGKKFEPAVFVKDWQMASLDGISHDGIICEIKCPGEIYHKKAKQGQVPDIYYPQLQHQLHCADAAVCLYVSFDGADIAIVEVFRDDDYIDKMTKEELAFYECIKNRVPPEDYVVKDDPLWCMYAKNLMLLTEQIKGLQDQEQMLRDALITLCQGESSRGAGVTLKKIKRKGAIDYEAIPELKKIDLEKYRKEPYESWRVTFDKKA